MSTTFSVRHGGDLLRAKRLYPQVQLPWVDLSTGISPWSWPVPAIPADCWRDLPEDQSAVIQAASDYYQVDRRFLRVANGTQSIIERLPAAMPTTGVALPVWGYQEHAKHWKINGHTIYRYSNESQLQNLIDNRGVSIAVVINPNNPTAEFFERDDINRWRQQLNERNGYLVVDEAFMDASPQGSSTELVPLGGLILLRSLGKFFGLAGIRVGFVAAPSQILERLESSQPLWPVATPSLWIAEQALKDSDWQSGQVDRLLNSTNELSALLSRFFPLSWVNKGPLFCTVMKPICDKGLPLQGLVDHCASDGIWLRYFEENQGVEALRIGVCDDDVRTRLSKALSKYFKNN